MTLALITGASSGIGAELARIHAARGGDLVLVARRLDRLEALRDELEAAHGVSVTPVEADLATPGGIEATMSAVEGREVDVLINNAGFGGRGAFLDHDRERELMMVDLNVRALVDLTHRLAGPMVARGRGRILQVGSTAGFLPGPMQATYFATKAFVNSFGQALSDELRDTGVTVTVLAPGAVDTEFADVADMRMLDSFRGAASARSVAEFGYRAMERGELVAINDRKIAAMVRTLSLTPRRLVLKMAREFMTKGT